MAQNGAQSLEVLPAPHLPGDVGAILGGGEPPVASAAPTKPPENPWPARCRPCPGWGSATPPRPRPRHMGPCFSLRGHFYSLVSLLASWPPLYPHFL